MTLATLTGTTPVALPLHPVSSYSYFPVIANPDGFYVKISIYRESSVGSGIFNTLVNSVNFPPGILSGSGISISNTTSQTLLALIPNSQTMNFQVKIESFSDSGYSSLVGTNNYSGIFSAVVSATKPTFTNWALTAVAKTIDVIDAYGNTVISSALNTLTGATDKVVKGYSKVRATITVANKMTALYGSTAIKYTHSNGLQNVDGTYSSGSDVTIDIDNATSTNSSVVALDSRGLSTAVNKSLSLLAEYIPLFLAGLTLERDNQIDAPVTLGFLGTLWNNYFSSNTTTNPGSGILNSIQGLQYRFKQSSRSWGFYDGNFTVTIASPGVFTKSSHGFETGDSVWLSTSGALPTGLTVGTQYYVIKINSSTFNLATTYANAIAGTKINTSGSQSGTHSLSGEYWATLTPSIDGSGNITFSSHINGDLGSGGFTITKSFTLEVRGYDRLSVVILSGIINKGSPLVDYYTVGEQAGVSINGRYDPDEGGSLQVDGQDILNTIFGSENRLINGNFDIWQRNTTATDTADSSYDTADRWKNFVNANGGTLPTHVVYSRQALTPGDIPYSKYNFRIAPSGAGVSFGNSAYAFRAQYIEHGTRSMCGDSKFITISFYAKSSISGKKIGVALRQSYGTTGSSSDEELLGTGQIFTLTSSWTKYTVTLETNTLVGKTFGTDNNDHLRLAFFYMWGSTIGSSFLNSATSENYGGSGTIDIAQIDLKPGISSAFFLPKTFVKELQDCQRYYEKSYDYTVVPGTGGNTYNGGYFLQLGTNTTGIIGLSQPFKVKKAKVPTITLYDPDGTVGTCFRGAMGKAVTATGIGDNGFFVTCTDLSSASAINGQWIAEADF